MTNRSFIPIILTYGLVMAGLVTRRGELLVLALPFVCYLLVGLWRAPGEFRLEIQRSFSQERIRPDSRVEVKLTVRNNGHDLDEVLLEDILPPGLHILEGSNRHLLRIRSGQPFSWTYSVSGGRGYYAFTSVKVEAGDVFGLLKRKRSLSVGGQLFILPSATRIKRVAIRPRRTNVYSGVNPAHLGGAGVEFFGVRAYQRGDPLHWINWNASARHPGELFSTEFEQERVSDVGMVLDSRLGTNIFREGHSLFEYSIQAAATLADTFLAEGNRVGLLLYGHALNWTVPGYGKIQRERILQALARSGLGDSQVFADLGHIPTQIFPAHSQIVLVSPLVPGDYEVLLQLRAHAYQVMVISPDPVSFELAYLPKNPQVELAGRILRLERDVLLRKLRHAGVQVLDWDVAQPFDQVAQAALGRPLAWFKAIGR